MSDTIRRLSYTCTTADPDHWTVEHRNQAETDPGGSYDDWVVEQLDQAMRTAGDAFIAAHPDLFAVDQLA